MIVGLINSRMQSFNVLLPLHLISNPLTWLSTATLYYWWPTSFSFWKCLVNWTWISTICDTVRKRRLASAKPKLKETSLQATNLW